MISYTNTPLKKIEHPFLDGLNVFIKEDFRNHPKIQGNKLHKLRLNLEEAKHYDCVITFGGAYSNHIAATAYACNELNIPCIGIIRGNELKDNQDKWSHTLKEAKENGMNLVFVSREEYRNKDSMDFTQYGNCYVIPEGGTNELAVEGLKSLANEISQEVDYNFLYTAVGTGGTISGLIRHTDISDNKKIIGVSTLKDSDYLNYEITKLSQKNNFWMLNKNAHFGGYGKTPKELLLFKDWFEGTFDTPLDPIYTSKTMYSFFSDLNNHRFKEGDKIVLLHTGGLQGNSVA